MDDLLQSLLCGHVSCSNACSSRTHHGRNRWARLCVVAMSYFVGGYVITSTEAKGCACEQKAELTSNRICQYVAHKFHQPEAYHTHSMCSCVTEIVIIVRICFQQTGFKQLSQQQPGALVHYQTQLRQLAPWQACMCVLQSCATSASDWSAYHSCEAAVGDGLKNVQHVLQADVAHTATPFALEHMHKQRVMQPTDTASEATITQLSTMQVLQEFLGSYVKDERLHAAILLAGVLVIYVAARLALGLVLFVQNYLRLQSGLASIPEAPGRQPLFGHAFSLLKAPAWDVMHGWLLRGDKICKFDAAGRQGVVVGDPVSAKRVFQTHQRIYIKDLDWAYHHFLDILGTGLVTANGDLWQRQRLLIGPVLRTEMLDEIIPMAKGAVDRLSKKLTGLKGSGRAVNMDDEFRLLTLQVIGEAVLSLPPEECDKVFPALYLPVMEEANLRVFRPWRSFLPGPSFWAYRSRVARLNSYLLAIIRKRWRERSNGAPHRKLDMLDRIMAAMEARGEKMTAAMEQQLCYEVKTFLLAGHETSAAMLTWSLYELTQHPDSLAKVKEEALQAFGQQESQPNRAAVEAMQFTLAALKESLRRYTVVPLVVRDTTKEDELCGHTIPAGTLVVMHLQAVHALWQTPESWQPQRFMPNGEYERFPDDIRPYMGIDVDVTVGNVSHRHPYWCLIIFVTVPAATLQVRTACMAEMLVGVALMSVWFLPFVAGPRNCLGQFFALIEARIVLALLVKRFKFRPLVRDVRRHQSVIPLGPEGGMPMLVD